MKEAKLTEKIMFRLLPAQILLSAVGVVNGIVSSLFAGNYVGVKAMAAVGLYSPVNLFLIALNNMFVSGATILCGECIGRNDKDGAKSIFSLDITIAGVFAIVATIGHLIYGSLGAFIGTVDDPEVGRMLCRYVFGQAVGIIPLVLGNQLSSFLSLDNRIKRTVTASLVYIGVNFVLNYIFIALMGMEVLGLALAPSIGLWVFFFIQIPPFIKKDAAIRYSMKEINWHEAAKILKIGIPGAANSGYNAIRGIIVNSLILTYVGGVGISAFTAANSIMSFFWQVPSGMLMVSRMMISVSVGEEDRKSLTDTMRVALFRFIPLAFAMSLFVIIMAVPFTRLYFRDPSDPVYMMTVRGFQILPVCMPLAIICTHFTCYWQTSDRHIPVHILSALDGLVGVVAFSALLMPAMKLNGLYVANVLNGLIAPVFVLIYACIYNKRFPKNIDELMSMPPTFGVPVYGRIDIAVHDMESVIGISGTLQEFCEKSHIDKRRAFYASLCLEEMVGNVIEHGFTKDKKKHSVHVCVACKRETLIMSVKDDCVPFNIEQRLKMIDKNDVAKNIGIRLVSGIASSIHYQNILGMNVLTIRFDGKAS